MAGFARDLREGTSHTHSVYSDTLRLLRERRCQKKKDVASNLGKDPSYVSRCESTADSPVLLMSTGERANYASVLRVPPATLSRSFAEAPPEGIHFHTRKLTAEKRRQAVAHAALTANHVNTLMELLDADPRADIPQIDVAGLGPREAGIEAARRTRAAWGLGMAPIEDLAGLFEGKGIFVAQMRDAVEGVRGMTMYLRDGAAPVVFLAPYVNDDTRRQTMAHELGHLVMDHASGPLGAKELEERATAFGGEFLAPWTEVRDAVSGLVPSQLGQLIDLQRKWGAHPAAFIQRGHGYGMFSDNQRRNWFVHLNVNKRLIDNLPSSFPVQERAIATLLENVRSLGWPEPQLSDCLGLRPDELKDALGAWPYEAPA